ncbi:MAG: hypothetical protein JWM76_154 [Pseudonocardiales bacterium]|nr:hypothetical protein [Pseudonocardiales bacterium]
MPLSGEYAPSPLELARTQVEKYESSGGTRGAYALGHPVVILTTVGARTGKIRKTPLMRVEHDGTYVVMASMAGGPRHPVWYYNVLAHPKVELQDGPSKQDMLAREATGAEKLVWWARAVATWPSFDEYQLRTEREIPLILLEPRLEPVLN